MFQSLPLHEDILVTHLKEVFGTQISLKSWNALTGGARKKVIHLKLTGTLKDVVLLVWQNEQDYFGERDNPESDRSDRIAPLLFKANTDLLLSAGVRVPQLYTFDASYQQFPFAYALVEYVQAVTFNEWLNTQSGEEIQNLFGNISNCLQRMHLIQRDNYGTILDDSPKLIPCHEQALQEASLDLKNLALAFETVRGNEIRIRQKLEELYQAISPRDRYSFIHDELGPDEHLLIGQGNEIFLIDIDGCHFFDLEREHAYLKLRFGRRYEYLERHDLDEKRMQLYTFCLHITAAYGHYQLYRKGYPNPESLRAIYEGNIQKFLNLSLVH